MFEKNNDVDYLNIQKDIMNFLVNSYVGEIIMQSTPVLQFKLSKNCIIRVKHPYFSQLLHNRICDDCRQYNQCFEKICAIRVHPNGVVTPCLFGELSFKGQTIHAKLEDAYNRIKDMVLSSDIYY